MKYLNCFVIFFLLFRLGHSFAQHIPCYGALPQPTINNNAASTWNSTNAKYNTQEYYQDLIGPNTIATNTNSIPFPQLTLNVSIHIAFRTTASALTSMTGFPYGPGSNMVGAPSNPSLQDPMLLTLISSIENNLRTSIDRKCSQNDAYNIPGIHYTRVKFKVKGVHFYYNDNYVGTGAFAQAVSASPFFDEGLPLMLSFDQGSSGLFSNGSPGIYLGGPIDAIGSGALNSSLLGHISHELGHAFGLYHTYYGGNNGNSTPNFCTCYTPTNFTNCLPASSPEFTDTLDGKLDGNHPDYLADVFTPNQVAYLSGYPNIITTPIPCLDANGNPTVCGQASNCFNPPPSIYGSNFEVDAYCTNNIMSAGNQYPCLWISPLQNGRRVRALHLEPIRRWVEDVESDHVNAILIQQNEYWQHDVQVYQDIRVKSGATLRLGNILSMARNGKIIVEKGAKLLIDYNVQVKGWSRNGLWKGIEVEGTPNAPQTITNGLCATQGIVEATVSIISNARYAIYTSLTDNNLNYIPNTGGGIVQLSKTVLRNNVWGVVFFPHLYNTNSFINDVQFQRTNVIGYEVGSTTPIVPREHIKLWGNTGLNIKGSTFSSTYAGNTGSNKGIGIFSVDSRYTIDLLCLNGPCSQTKKTVFNGMNVGVYFDDINPLNGSLIQNSEFNNNLNTGIIGNNSSFLQVQKNNFTGPYYGMYMNESKNYVIKKNNFTDGTWTGLGILAKDSKSGLHIIYDNTFSSLNMGINAIDLNAPDGSVNNPYSPNLGLKMNCNNFTPNNSNNGYDIALTASGQQPPIIMENQSSPLAPQSALQTVRNQYNAVSFGYENKYYVDPLSTQIIMHRTTIDPICRPNIPLPQASPHVNVVVANGFSFNYQLYCAQATTAYRNADSPIRDEIARLFQYASFLQYSDADIAERNTALTSLLGCYLSEGSSASLDSVISITQRHNCVFHDYDLYKVFYFMKKKDFDAALLQVNALSANRSAWKSLFPALIRFTRDDYQKLSPADSALFQSSAANPTQEGSGTSKACLRAMYGIEPEFPNPQPRLLGRSASLSTADRPEKIEIFPNPFTNLVEIEATTARFVSFIDANGRVVKNIILESMNADLKQVSTAELSPGLYLIKLSDENNKPLSSKIMVKQ